MRTVRLLTVSHCIPCISGGLLNPPPPQADRGEVCPSGCRPLCYLWCMLWSQPLHPVNRMTDRCKNITLLQTSFAGGKYHVNRQQPPFWLNGNYYDREPRVDPGDRLFHRHFHLAFKDMWTKNSNVHEYLWSNYRFKGELIQLSQGQSALIVSIFLSHSAISKDGKENV